jgi:16S rRNA processing protein RimM
VTQVVLGRIAGVFGLKGWVKVFSHTEPREGILDYQNWLLRRGDGWQAVKVEDGKPHGKSVIVKLASVEDPEAAAELLDAEIAVQREDLPQTDDGQYYWSDLEGLQVIHRDGRSLGKVAYLMATGANDVLVVEGDSERLIPFVMGDVILNVDLGLGQISVDWDWD